MCVSFLYIVHVGDVDGECTPHSLFDGSTYEVATFAMRWFWLPEGRFGVAPGVLRTKVVYTGGTAQSPTYKNLWVKEFKGNTAYTVYMYLIYTLKMKCH